MSVKPAIASASVNSSRCHHRSRADDGGVGAAERERSDVAEVQRCVDARGGEVAAAASEHVARVVDALHLVARSDGLHEEATGAAPQFERRPAAAANRLQVRGIVGEHRARWHPRVVRNRKHAAVQRRSGEPVDELLSNPHAQSVARWRYRSLES